MDFNYDTETITPDTGTVLTIGGTGALGMPVGTTGQEPGSAITGWIRWNTTTGKVEFFDGSTWQNTATESFVAASTVRLDQITQANTNVTLLGNDANPGGSVSLRSGNAVSGNTVGGDLSFTGGSGNGSGHGGALNITAGGTVSGNAIGGALNLTAGAGNGNGTGGTSTLAGGNASGGGNGQGGPVNINGGTSTGNQVGGTVTITGGATTGTGAAGGVTITGGTPNNGDGGAVSISGSGGVGTNKNGGNLTLAGGNNTGSGTAGTITLQTAATSRLVIGAAGGWTVNASEGISGYLLTSNGAGTTPTWSPLSLGSTGNCRVATTGNISLAAPGATIDGSTMVSGDRVLVWQQTTLSQNGIYIWNGAATPMTRAFDMDSWDEVPGRFIYVTEGTVYALTSWQNDSAYTGTIDVTDLTWTSSFRRIGPGARYDFGDSWTPTRANSAFGPRVFSLIDTKAVVRIWRFIGDGSNPGIEFVYGTNDDAANAANDWWDVTLNESPNAGVRIASRTGGVTNDKVFASTTGVRIGPNVAETNPAVSLSIDATDAVLFPVGSTGQRPTGVNGYARYNSTLNLFEYFENGVWVQKQTTLQLYKENPSTPTASTVAGTNAVAIGQGHTASGTDAVVLGGNTNTASATFSSAIGNRALSNIYGGFAQASGRFAADGDAQTRILTLRTQTTNATVTEMFLDGTGGTQRLVLPNDTTWAFRILIVARRTDADNESAVYEFVGGIDRNTNAASTAIVGVVSKTNVAEDTAAWDTTVDADTTNGSLRIRVTGQAAKTINWVARVQTVEVTG